MLFAIAVAAMLTACSGYEFTPGAPSTYLSNTAVADAPASRPLVGVAISGGGNRSALFASYVLELLGSLPVAAPAGTDSAGQPISFLDTVDHISSVSGGSFAASYFSMKGIGHYSEMLTGSTIPTPYAQFFDDFHQQMNFNWEAALFGFKIVMLGSNADGLARAIDTQYLHGATFADLDKREASGASPYLILNATHYDTGRRFVMTTIPSAAFCLNTEKFLLDVVYAPTGQTEHVDDMHEAQLSKCDRSDALTPEGFDNFWNPRQQSVPSADMPLARAVATSGAFPLVVGPIAYRVSGDHELLHLIDGGVADNSGIESLSQLFLRDLLKTRSHRDLIISLDASLPFNAYGATIAGDKSPLSAFIDDPTRVSDIQEVRASLYRQDLWNVTTYAARTMKRSSSAITRLDIVGLKPDDLNVSSLRIDTPECHAHYDDKKAVTTAARDIPTRYHLDACDAQLVRIAACWSVHQHAQQIQQFFDARAGNGRRTSGGYGQDEETSGRNADGGPNGDRASTGMLESRIKQMCPELVADHAL
ncbi:patatin-like phospholipase family protein [Paraburkholderia rhizosphaerae]|uniref:patatin-like phospholipase family protein n=1 Tax=Paraburkholderia rhizosphaerae TaxID=480658 RepID=UPI001416FA7F|nr:patatin-like phospholipase family protein [Paraburkholderia rhizosphaerae]